MKQDETRRRLIDGTIHVIARDGLDKATTKQIGLETSINEAYIYRCFEDKEDMFAKTFDFLDQELEKETSKHLEVMTLTELDFETRCRLYFFSIWKFMLGNREKFLAYVRYYYSTYFKKHSAKKHKELFRPLVEKFSEAFLDEADVWMIFNHILNVMLAFAVMVYNDEMPKEDDYSEHVFRVVYAAVKQYFRK